MYSWCVRSYAKFGGAKLRRFFFLDIYEKQVEEHNMPPPVRVNFAVKSKMIGPLQ